ncbi:MAG: tetratricopeptide repeat protein [Bacteroidota bacterium]
MKKSTALLLCMILVAPAQSSGQFTLIIDSLLTELGTRTTDSARCRLMLEIATIYKTTDTISAIQYLEEGRRLADEAEDKNCLGRYYEIRGEMHAQAGLYDRAIIEYDRALSSYNEADNDIGYYEALKDKGNVYLFKSEYTQAMSYYETALDYYRRNGMVQGASRCLNNMGIIYKNRGAYVDALTVYDESIKFLDEEKEPMLVAQGYINMGNVFVFLGSYERALEYFEMALDISEREQSEKEIGLCLLNSGVIQNKCGHFAEANDFYGRALSLGKRLGDPVMISNSLINIGTNYAEMGRLGEGLGYVEQGMNMKIELGDERTISNCIINLAEIYYKKKDFNRAIELFNEAIPVKVELGDQEGLVRSYLGLARVNADQRNYQTADFMSDQALAIAVEIGSLEHKAVGYGLKQKIAEARGDYRSAYQYAMEYYRTNDSLMDASTTRAVMEMEFRHRSKVLEKENENLRIQSGLSSELMQKKNALMYSIAGIAILLAAAMLLGTYFLRRLRFSSLKLEEKNLVITKQNLKLDAMNRTKDRMMSIIAHDLRGTIGNQLTAIEVLHRVETSNPQGIDRKRLLGNLKHSASYSLELLENLLHWSRLDENSNYFHPEEINLGVVVSGCISLFDETARQKNITMVQEVDKSINIHADRIMLETIVRNLLSNSIKFSEPGGSISVSAVENDGGINFEVTDQGIGMTGEQINKVLHNGGYTKRGTANEKGAGIGMTLVREFTHLHKGVLTIESKPGEGTRMKITFPKLI